MKIRMILLLFYSSQVSDKYLEIQVKDPHKVGDGISAYLTYQVITRTNIGLFKKTEMTVERRFSDFLGLHDKLVEKYLHKGRLVPAPPEKNVMGIDFDPECLLHYLNFFFESDRFNESISDQHRHNKSKNGQFTGTRRKASRIRRTSQSSSGTLSEPHCDPSNFSSRSRLPWFFRKW